MTFLKKPIFLVVALWAGLLAGKAQTLTGKQALVNYLATLQQQDGFGGAGIGVCVKYVDNGETIAELNPTLALVPASTQKLVTTAAALVTLGEGFRFKTELQFNGSFDATTGELNGNLYIRGGGDPTLGSEKFESTAVDKLLAGILEQMKTKGVKSVNGQIIGDDNVFEQSMAPASWNWGDLGNYYGAGASGLTISDNMIYLHFRSGANPGDSTWVVKVEPQVPGLMLFNEVRSGKKYSGDNAYIFGSEYTYLRYARGTIPPAEQDFTVKGSIPDPTYYCAWLLDDYLRKNGISISGKPTTTRLLKEAGRPDTTLDSRITIGEIKSPTLSSIVSQINIYSNNLYAEHVQKALAYRLYGLGSNTNGNDALQKFWVKKGLDSEQLFVADGCGLSRNNAISARNLTQLLLVMVKETCFESFYNSLPVSGKSGTMRGIGKGTLIENNAHAKSGSMSRVRSYAGYVKNKKGREVAFSMIFNNFTCDNKEIKEVCEHLMIKIAETE